METGVADNLFTVGLHGIRRLIVLVVIQEYMELLHIRLKVAWYDHASLRTECDRILLERETCRLTETVLKHLCGKRDQIGVAEARLNISEYLVD